MQTQKNTPKQNSLTLIFDKLKKIRIDATLLVLLTFILLWIFKLIDLLLTNKAIENMLVIPFQLVIFMLPALLFAEFRSPSRPMDYIKKLRIKRPCAYQIPLIASGIVALSSGCILLGFL